MKHLKITCLFGALFFSTASLAASVRVEPFDFAVSEFINPGSVGNLVLITGGKRHQVIEGMTFKTTRKGFVHAANPVEPIYVPTGTLKAIKVMDNQTIAEVIENGTDLSRSSFTRFPGVMAGDFVKIAVQNIEQRSLLLPELSIEYRRIFDDPNSIPSSFEISEKGKELLQKETEVFANAKMERLVVEGYTDLEGAADANQVESTQRAMTVRQYLIDELGYDAERVIAIGYGEISQLSDKLTPESKVKNRRIMIKVLPQE